MKTQSRNVDFSAAASTKPFRTGTTLPSACSVGEAYFKTNEPPGSNWFACTSTNVWTLESGAEIPDPAGQGGKVLSSTGNSAEWRAPGGDIDGAPEDVRVRRIQGRTVAATPPGHGQTLRWNSTGNQWEPQPLPEAGAANYSHSFASATSLTIPGAAHGLGTANLLIQCYDSAIPNQRLTPSSVSVDPSTYDVVVAFGTAQSGRCVVNGNGGVAGASASSNNTFAAGTTQSFLGSLVATSAERTAPVKSGATLPASCLPGDQFFKTDAAAGQNLYFCTAANVWSQMRGGGDVATVFGRSGAVVAQAGDYSFSQISGTVADSQVAPGLNASKIGVGAVTNTAFGYLANVNSDIQAQLNLKAATGHSHTTGGDLSGDAASATVIRLQGRAVSNSAPADGQALVWNGAASTWAPGTVSGTGGTSFGQINDLRVTRTTATVLNIAESCTTAAPCNVRFGNIVYSFTRSCMATLASGTGTAFIYVASGGVLTVGHNMGVSASAGCVAQSSVTSFPADSIPLFTWSAANGAWDSAGGRDFRAALSQKAISAGTGIMTVESGGRTTVGVDPAIVPMYMSGSGTINFPSIPAGNCSADQSMAVAGAAVGDSVAPGWPAALEPGLLGTMRVSAADAVSVRLCNVTGAAVDPAAGTFRATIIRSF